MKQLLTVLLLTAATFGSGCSELDPFLPKVSFESLQVRAINFQEADVDFVFDVENPNPIGFKLSSFSYALGFEEVQLLAGDNEDGFALEAEGNSELVLPVDLVFADAWNVVQATRGKDDIGFGLDGHFGFNLPELGEARVPYNADGQFPAVRTPQFSLKNLRAADVNLLGATLELDLGIDNDHESTLFFEMFSYDISLGGKSVAGGMMNTLADVSGASEETVTLPIEVDFLTAAVVIIDAIVGGGSLEVGLDADMDVITPFTDTPLPLSIDQLEDLFVVD